MKIVFLARKFYPEIGGVEKHCLELGKRLVRKGHELTVITETPKISSSNDKQSKAESARLVGEVEGIKIKRLNQGQDDWFKKFRIWKEMWKQKDTLKKADIIHCHDVFFWYLLFRLIYFRKPVFTTFHGYEGNKIPGKKAIVMHKIGEKLSKGNICVGDFFKKWYGTKPTIVIYGAVDKIPVRQNLFNKKPLKDVMFLGRLEEETGIMQYLEALNILKEKKINLSVDIFGNGAQMDESITYSKTKDLNVKFEGFVSNASDLIYKYEYVFCSRYLGILEALIFKKPVFAVYNNSIKKDYLQMSAFREFIFIEKNAEEIANDLLKPISKDKIDSGYEWAKKQTWEKMVNDYLNLWADRKNP